MAQQSGTWGCAASGGDGSVRGISGQRAGVAVGILGTLLQAGTNPITQERKQPRLVYGMGTEPFSTGEVGGKLKQKGHPEVAHSLLKMLSDKILIWGMKDVLLL